MPAPLAFGVAPFVPLLGPAVPRDTDFIALIELVEVFESEPTPWR